MMELAERVGDLKPHAQLPAGGKVIGGMLQALYP